MSIKINLEDVPDEILEVVKARILKSRKSRQTKRETKPKPALQPLPQLKKLGADTKKWRRPEYAVKKKGDGFVLVPHKPAEVKHVELIVGGDYFSSKFGNLRDKPAEDRFPDFQFPGFQVLTIELPSEGLKPEKPKTAMRMLAKGVQNFTQQKYLFGLPPWAENRDTWNALDYSFRHRPPFSRNFGFFYHITDYNNGPEKKVDPVPNQLINVVPGSQASTKAQIYNVSTFEVILSLPEIPADTYTETDILWYGPYGGNAAGPNSHFGRWQVTWITHAVTLKFLLGGFQFFVRCLPYQNPIENGKVSDPFKPVYEIAILETGGQSLLQLQTEKWEKVDETDTWKLVGEEGYDGEFNAVDAHIAVVRTLSTPYAPTEGARVKIYLNGKQIYSAPAPPTGVSVNKVLANGFMAEAYKITDLKIANFAFTPGRDPSPYNYTGSMGQPFVQDPNSISFYIPWPDTYKDNYKEEARQSDNDLDYPGFHGFRFTPEEALYGSQPPDPSTGISFTPPTTITDLA